MIDDPAPGPSIPADRYRDAEAALGGADAVEKTSYVTGSGTDPQAIKPTGSASAKVPSGAGQSATWAVIAFLLIGAVLVYVLGFGR